MLRKEVQDALKRFIESLLTLLIIPFTYLADKLVTKTGLDYPTLIQTAFIFTLVIYAAYAGATFFQSERKDRAFEYLFSLPLTRKKIILVKLVPRLVLLLILGVAGTSIVGPGLLKEGITFLVLFFSSLFLSIGVFSIVINLFGVLFMYLIFYQGEHAIANLVIKLGGDSAEYSGFFLVQCISAVVLLVPFGIAFWLTFKKMDVRPIKQQMKTYYSIVLPTLVVLVSVIVFLSKRLVAG
jgi:ABC-type Na+ efflux pump permease subunit